MLRLVEAAHAHEPNFGLLIEAAAVTGARLSQLARLVVGDLLFNPARLTVPRSAKGRTRTKQHERRPVPIPEAFAALLRQRCAGRPADAPLLIRANGTSWPCGRNPMHQWALRTAVEAAGLDPDKVTLYHFRHSSIVRQLLANVPIRVVAALHDTGVAQIEKNYARYIANHSDALARGAMLQVRTPANIIALPRKRKG